MFNPKHKNAPPWQTHPFQQEDVDPLAGFANIMDVMLVFALGLMLALISQSQDFQAHFNLQTQPVTLEQGKELSKMPEALKQQMNSKGTEGMESLGQVYRDPETGKLLLIGK